MPKIIGGMKTFVAGRPIEEQVTKEDVRKTNEGFLSMKKSNQDLVLICSEVNFMKTEGQWRMCCVCAAEIFVSELTVQQINRDGYELKDEHLYCSDCGLKKMQAAGANEFVPPSPEIWKAAKKWVSENK